MIGLRLSACVFLVGVFEFLFIFFVLQYFFFFPVYIIKPTWPYKKSYLNLKCKPCIPFMKSRMSISSTSVSPTSDLEDLGNMVPIKTNSWFLDLIMNEMIPPLWDSCFLQSIWLTLDKTLSFSDVTHGTNEIISWHRDASLRENNILSMCCCHRSWRVNGIFGKLNSALESFQGCNLPRHGQCYRDGLLMLITPASWLNILPGKLVLFK